MSSEDDDALPNLLAMEEGKEEASEPKGEVTAEFPPQDPTANQEQEDEAGGDDAFHTNLEDPESEVFAADRQSIKVDDFLADTSGDDDDDDQDSADSSDRSPKSAASQTRITGAAEDVSTPKQNLQRLVLS